MGETVIKKTLQMEERFTKNEIEIRKYEQREKALHDYYSDMKTSRDKGRQEGLQEGLQEGIQKGMQEVIQVLIQDGFTIEKLAESLHMTEDEVKKYLEK